MPLVGQAEPFDVKQPAGSELPWPTAANHRGQRSKPCVTSMPGPPMGVPTTNLKITTIITSTTAHRTGRAAGPHHGLAGVDADADADADQEAACSA